MPINVVKTQKQEIAWEKAKRLVKRQYPDISEKDPRFYKLVMTLYKSISGYRPRNESLVEYLKNRRAKV